MGSSLSTIGHSMFVHLWILKLQELVEGNFFFSQVMTISMTAAPTTNTILYLLSFLAISLIIGQVQLGLCKWNWCCHANSVMYNSVNNFKTVLFCICLQINFITPEICNHQIFSFTDRSKLEGILVRVSWYRLQLLPKMCIVTLPLAGLQSTPQSMSVCLSVCICLLACLKNHISKLYKIFCACCLWLWLSLSGGVVVCCVLPFFCVDQVMFSYCAKQTICWHTQSLVWYGVCSVLLTLTHQWAAQMARGEVWYPE